MKNILILSILMAVSFFANGQITYRNTPVAIETVPAYDSSSNIPPKIKSLYSQSVLIVETNELYRKMKSSGELVDSSAINRQYKVVSSTKDENRRLIWLHLADKADTIYCRLTASLVENPPFITTGFYTKQKKNFVGKSFRLKTSCRYTELISGKIKEYPDDEVFKCIDVTMLKEGSELIPSYILKTKNGDEISVPIRGFETIADNTLDNRFYNL